MKRNLETLAAVVIAALFLLASSARADGPVSDAARRPGLIEIVIAGPELGRGTMKHAVQTALASEANVAWSERDALPDDQPWRFASTQIWIDVTDPIRVRIFLPPGAPRAAGGPVRTIDTPASEEDDWKPVARETVAQIVRSAVQILSGDAGETPRTVAMAPAPPDALVPPPTMDAEVSQRLTPPPTALAAGSSNLIPRGRFGVAIGAGAHTSPFLLAEPHTESHWLGASLQLAGRWETPKLLLAIRASWEPSERTIDTIDLQSQLYSTSMAASRRFTFGEFTFSLGGEVGGLFIRQEVSETPESANSGASPYSTFLGLPGQAGTTWSSGVLFGPIAELSVAVTQHAFIHLGAGRPIAFMNIDDNGSQGWHTSSYWRLVGGFGATR